jgi:glycine/D-amino acid oxidase-like deaminating enzyme
MGEVLHTDIVIIGAGITGAFLAERFTRDGHTAVLLDRRPPTQGSTSASTAMLLWELDASLLELEGRNRDGKGRPGRAHMPAHGGRNRRRG